MARAGEEAANWRPEHSPPPAEPLAPGRAELLPPGTLEDNKQTNTEQYPGKSVHKLLQVRARDRVSEASVDSR